ncbi:Carbohydrate-binding module family 1 protein [Mycena venus]|uniref:Carbohydrate-binding module family 1 protein n=1 Tax=Mycena venus TaxID=2733690 RepID=A0A8H7DAQ9_9AGAR|nr:Carbohydrate-binding module family 1 protein [Mycena venus]
MALLTWVTLGLYALSCKAGTTIWSGSFNAYPTVATFDVWSWSNEVGEYQWYIHGSQNTSHYLALSPSFKNPADTSETNGLKLTIDTTSSWNGQPFERSELIPQTTQNLGTGNLFYHFSISHPSTNLPDSTVEHQICFFESHFTEVLYNVQEVPYWDAPFDAGTWFNFAYDIDFTAGTVGLWASTGNPNPLVKVVQNVAAATSTNSEDWHLGVLRVVNSGTPEDWYYSGVYIENGPITTSVGSGTGKQLKMFPVIDHHLNQHFVYEFYHDHVVDDNRSRTNADTVWTMWRNRIYWTYRLPVSIHMQVDKPALLLPMPVTFKSDIT